MKSEKSDTRLDTMNAHLKMPRLEKKQQDELPFPEDDTKTYTDEFLKHNW